jgi:hypothetical protein
MWLGALFLIITAGVFPLAREGFFASGSMFQGTLLIQAALFAAVWAVAWSTLTGHRALPSRRCRKRLARMVCPAARHCAVSPGQG